MKKVKVCLVLCIVLLISILGINHILAAPCGDTNSDGNINIADALLIAQFSVAGNPANFDQGAADVNGDGNVNIADALLVAQYYVGIIDSLSCQQNSELETVFAVNCGGSAYTASDGTQYSADTGYSGGNTYDNGKSVSGTSDGTLYSTERYGNCIYSIAVPNGEYRVILHFAENYHTSTGVRIFNVNMEGTQAISNLDVYDKAGANNAYVTENQVSVSDGELNIEFVTVTENALINAIKVDVLSYSTAPVVTISNTPTPINTPTPTSTTTSNKLCALTFDDGPDTTLTALVLDKLDKYSVNATFFMIGQKINSSTSGIVQRVVNSGNEIGNHSWGYSSMTGMTTSEIQTSVNNTTAAIQQYSGTTPKFFRPPNLAVNSTMYSAIDLPFASGITANDWDQSTTAQQRADAIINNIRDGAIILLHDVQPLPHPTPEALDIIIPTLKNQGYEFVTLSELFRRKGVTPSTTQEIMYTYVQ